MLLTDTLLETSHEAQIHETGTFKIAVEVQRMFRPQKHGMDVVAHELLKRLHLAGSGYHFHVMVKDDADQCLSTVKNRIIHKIKKAPYCIWEQYLLPKACHEAKADVLHCTANTAPIFGKMPLILTLHDIIFLEQSNLISKASWYQRLGNLYRSAIVSTVAKKAVKIITVSEYQKEKIVKRLGIAADKVEVVYNGADERFFEEQTPAQIDAVMQKYRIEVGYLFFMANTEPRKNTIGVLNAYAKLLTLNRAAPRLVMKGLKLPVLEQLLKEQQLEYLIEYIDIIGYVDYADLPAIYRGASMLLFPSLSEGFGLPIIEAMAGGVPVVTSDTSCMPEIAGDAALLVDPYNPASIASAINLILIDSDLARDLSAAGKERALKFTWNTAIAKTIGIYREVEESLTNGN
jgi:glycosyltransferase involved in cell wall biosynthesis